MNVDYSMCAPAGKATHQNQCIWIACVQQQEGCKPVSSRQQGLTVLTGSAHAGLGNGLSRMRRKSHVRFLGEGVAATPLPYPTRFPQIGAPPPVARWW